MVSMNDLHTKHGFETTGITINLNGVYRDVYTVSEEVRQWDGTEAKLALFSEQHQAFAGCWIKITGRSLQVGSFGKVFLRCRIVFESDSERESCAAEIVVQGWPEIQEIRKALKFSV